jgi:hypothetical protein
MTCTFLKYQGKTPLSNQYTLKKMKDRKLKTGPVWGRVGRPVGEER